MFIKYKYLVWLRIVMAILPLYGYIHPDEYFQSVEVVTGDVLNLEVYRTWEFAVNAKLENYIRSMVFPYVTIGIPIYLLKILSNFSSALLGISLITPTSVLLTIRLTYCALSFIIDVCLKRICEREKKDPKKYLTVLGTSYVTLVLACRTFSNSIEALLLAVLVDLVTDLARRRKPDGKITLKLLLMSLVLVGGFFNRPTFLLYALVPGLAYFFLTPNFKFWWKKMVGYCLGYCCGTFLLFLIADAVYYMFYDWKSFTRNIFSGNVFLLTPLNFIMYNLKPQNLAEHGLHPRFTHFLVNEPLLFGPLSFGAWILVDLFRFKRGPLFSHNFLFKALIFTPLFLFSLFSHQEPRFLTALLLPVVFLNAERVTSSKMLFKAWIAFNIFLTVIFGVLHQGGVIPSLKYIQNFKVNSRSSEINAVYFHTYMPPRFLLMNAKSSNSSISVKLHDLMGSSTEHLAAVMRNFDEAILVSPSSLREEIGAELKNEFDLNFNTTFRAHISFEDLPNLDSNFFHNLGLDIQTVRKISQKI